MKKATQQQTKEHNKRLILKTIYNEQAISRADIARLTRLTRTTVSSGVTELIEDGLVEEVGFGPSEAGKPPILLSILANASVLIGLDLGGNVFRGGLFDLRGNVHHRIEMLVEGRTGDAALALVYQLVNALLEISSGPVLGIGIGISGITDAVRGVVHKSAGLAWHNLPLRQYLKERYDLQVHIANDSQAAAFGEYAFECEKEEKGSNLVVVKAGQGTSAGTVLNRKLYCGDGPGPGEIGHLIIINDGEKCVCGRYGCLETVASNWAIIKQARRIAQTNPDSKLHQFAQTPDEINFDTVLQAFNAGDPEVEQSISNAGHYLGIAIAHIITILNVHRVVIGGRLTLFGENLLLAVQAEVNNRILQNIADKTDIKLSSQGQDIVIKGAAALVLSYELGVV